MNIFEFGDEKLRQNDIDPLYGACVRVLTTRPKLAAYTLAFVAFDHAGLAAKILDAGRAGYWAAMHAAVTGTLRGSPRRYYRGAGAHRSIDALSALCAGDPWRLLCDLSGPYAAAQARVRQYWPGWGPTAAWKICDMAERVCRVPIDFTYCEHLLISNDMVHKGAQKACSQLRLSPITLFEKMGAYKWATLAPPHFDRPLGLQEFETLLCYYSHDESNSKHLPGNDKLLIKKELAGWGQTAKKLSEAIL